MSENITLTSLDYVFLPLIALYFYEENLKVEDLKSSLARLIEKDLPILSSVIEKVENSFQFKFVSPSNVTIEEKNVEEEIEKLYLPNEEGLLDIDEGKKLAGLFGDVNINLDWGKQEPTLGEPVLKLFLLHTPHQKSVLLIYSQHCVLDAFSLASFMNAWDCEMRLCPEKRIIKKFDIQRGLKPTEGYDMFKNCDRKEMDCLRGYHFLKTELKEEIGMHVIPSNKGVTKFIHFQRSALEQLKKEANTIESEKGYFISSNDCICAYIWRLHTILRKNDYKSGILPFHMVVNFRGTKGSPVDIGYFGNGVLVTNMDYSAKEILKMTYPEMVHKVRELVMNTDESVVQTCIDIQHYMIENDMGYTRSSVPRKTAIQMNDWRGLDRMRPEKCSRVELYPPMWDLLFPQNVCILMHPQNDGFYCKIMMENEIYDKIKDLDLSSLKSLEYLEKNYENL